VTTTLRLNPKQVAALAVAEVAIGFLDMTAQSLRETTPQLAIACAKASDTVRAAHEAFIAESQRTVSIAAPSEMAEAVKTLVMP